MTFEFVEMAFAKRRCVVFILLPARGCAPNGAIGGAKMTAYWMSRVQITDAAAYGEYIKRAGPAIEMHGGRFLARGGKYVTLEGDEYPRNVLVEFASLDQAVACYHSKEYQEAWEFQKDAATRAICIVEGI